MTQELKINREIRSHEVRLIDETGTQVGIVKTFDAFRRAQQAGLDLVEVSPTSRPPVCKIIDWGKFRYELKKKAQSAKAPALKEIKMGYKIGEHDLDVRVNQAVSLLEKGHPVRVSIEFKGRENQHRAMGQVLLQNILDRLADIASFEKIHSEGRSLFTTLTRKSK